MKVFSFLVLCLLSGHALAQKNESLVRDLRSEWSQVMNANDSTESQKLNTIYFTIDAVSDRGSYVHVHSIRAHSVWCDGKLLGRFDHDSYLSVDSLARIYSGNLHFAIHVEEGADYLETRLLRFVPNPVVQELRLREKPYFLNFTILVCIILLLVFVLLVRSNAKVLFDYFNFLKLITLQERDEGIAAGRLGSSINLMIYLFVGMWLAFITLVIFHYTKQHWIASRIFSFTTVGEGFLKWLWLSALMVGALFLKILLASIGTGLFKFREGYTIQVLNFFRHIVLTVILFSSVLIFYFMSGVSQPQYYNFLIGFLGWLLVAWVLLIFLKLMSKAPFSGFHLFSYLCATEIFPLVIFFEILFF